MSSRPYVLSIAGLDPSGGAGLLADIKTFEGHKTLGLSVCTALTVQTDTNFEACHWVDSEVLNNQIKCLLERFDVQVVKIGVIESWDLLLRVVNYLKEFNVKVKVILDPVLKSTTDFSFHGKESKEVFDQVLSQIEVITPNYNEIQELYENKTMEETIAYMATKTNVYLKGGHNPKEKGVDILYLKNGGKIRIEPNMYKVFDKHGTGCVLSSSLAAGMANGDNLEMAALKAKKYVESFMNSNEGLLGYHSL